MCDLCNLCDFIKSQSKWSRINNLTNKCDWCNLCDFSKKKLILKKLETVTCVIHVTCVISLKVSPNGLILII